MRERDAIGPRRSLQLLLLCWTLAFVGYSSSLGGEFVFDDQRLLQHDDCHRGLHRIPAMFDAGKPTACTSRPIRSVSYAIDHALWGLDTFGYHLTNILLHGLVAFLLGLLVLQLRGGVRLATAEGKDGRAAQSDRLATAEGKDGRRQSAAVAAQSYRLAALAAALFALHPIATEAVAYISGRRDLLAALFSLLAARLTFSFLDRGGAARLFGALACFALAVASHEIAAALAAALPLVSLARSTETDLRAAIRELLSSRRAWLAFGAMGTLVVIYGAWKVFGANPSQRSELWGPNLGAHIGTVLQVHAHYLKQLVYPVELIADYSHDAFPISSSLFEGRALLAAFVVAALVAIAIWRWRRSALGSAVALSYLLLLLPVSQIIIHHELLAEHRLYLPATCFCVLLAALLDRAVARWSTLGWAIVAALLLTYAALTNSRNLDWRSEETLWARTVEQAPRCARALGNYGTQLLERGKVEQARDLLARAVKIRPELCAAKVNLGEALLRTGETKRGLAMIINQGNCLQPWRHQARIARAHAMLRQWPEAAAAYRRAIARYPGHAKLQLGLAEALHAKKDPQAIPAYRRALELRPDWRPALFGLGRALAETCQQRQAREVLGRLRQLLPASSPDLRATTDLLTTMSAACTKVEKR